MPAFTFNPNDLQRLNRLRFIPRNAALEHSAGSHANRRAGEGTDFLDFRGYAAGDDFRKIDWGLYGRLRQLFVRLQEAPRQLSVTLLLDVSRSMWFGKPVTKLHRAQQIACGLGFVALRNNDRLFAATFAAGVGSAIGPLNGARALGALIGFLQKSEGGGASDLLAAVRQIRAAGRGRGVVAILSDFLNVGPAEEAIDALAAGGGRALVVQVLDDLDRGIGLAGNVRLRDSETGKQVDVRVDARTLADYQARFESRREQLQAFCSRRRLTYVLADPGIHYVQVVSESLRSGGLAG
jgi:uncharacterized protein (DUF58 family)